MSSTEVSQTVVEEATAPQKELKSSPVKAAAEEVTKNGVENGAGDAPEVKKNGGVTKTEEVESKNENENQEDSAVESKKDEEEKKPEEEKAEEEKAAKRPAEEVTNEVSFIGTRMKM